VLATTVSELQEAVADLRDLVYGLHPTILAEQGLAAALAHLAGRASVPVRLSVELDQRLPGPLEAIVYFVVCEALANVEKHAHASSAFVRVVQREATLLVDVEDDGIGGADPAGSGLRGLADRVEASGGSLGVATSGAGTRVHVDLPCAS
jgi:signal transduction histidine kinase